MEYQEVKCRNCGSPMHVAESAERIRCPYCGTEYILNSRNRQENSVHVINYGGRGALFQSYLPSGWDYRIFDDNDSISTLATVCKGLQLFPQDMSAQLLFYPFAFYKDSAPKASIFSSMGIPGLSSGGEYQLDPMSMACNCRWLELPQYARRRIAGITSRILPGSLSEPELYPLPAETLQAKALRFQQTASQKLQKQANVFPGKFAFRVSAGGQLYEGYFATILARVPKNSSASSTDRITDFLKKGTAFMGAMYGIGGLDTSNWGRAFDALILCHSSASATSSCEAVFDRFLKELKYGPLYFALQDEELQRARQIQLQGAMVRQQNAIHASQNLSHTLSQTSDIVNQACQDHSRQMDHIYDHSTDGIRGVEHYRDSYGNAYQADVKYDHIYKNGNTFVASTDGSLQLGPDWEELKK